jgi:hypothetical protein
MRGELVPANGPIEGLVVRAWDDNGRRHAYRLVYNGRVWSDQQPLPSRPRKAHVDAVQRARVFVKTGEVR